MTTYQRIEVVTDDANLPSLDQYIQNVQGLKKEIIEDIIHS
jgi:hypothetical protein